MSFEKTKRGYANLWDKAQILPAKLAVTNSIAQNVIGASKLTLSQVESATGVPWFLVGCLLYREAPATKEGGLNFACYLGNGQLLNKVTTQVPKDRGPFPTFLAGAIDALTLQGMVGITEWTIERILYWAEGFNGRGYPGNSPYIWDYTDLYTGGLFTSDHHFDPNAWDKNAGVAALYKAAATAGIVTITREVLTQETKMATAPTTTTTTVVSPTAGFTLPNLSNVEASIEQFSGMLGLLGLINPSLATEATKDLPLLEAVLKFGAAIQNGTDPSAPLQTLLAALKTRLAS